MNQRLMWEYIEFVADRLLVMLGYQSIFDTANPVSPYLPLTKAYLDAELDNRSLSLWN